jgi:hypothetical protein
MLRMALLSSLPLKLAMVKTLLFLIEAVQGEATAGGLPVELAAPASEACEGANAAQLAAGEMEVDEQTTCEGQQLREDEGR